jgi:hypothetical protein
MMPKWILVGSLTFGQLAITEKRDGKLDLFGV